MIYAEINGVIKKLDNQLPLEAWGVTDIKLWEASSSAPDPLQSALNSLHYLINLVEGVEMKVAIVKDEKGSATNGGDFVAGAWRKRDLNSELDPDNLVNISNNSIIVNTAGTYFVVASAPATEVYYHVTRLLKNGVEVAQGDTADCVANHVVTRSRVSWVGSLAVNDVLTLEHKSYQTKLVYGFGYASTITSTNIYSVVELFRLGG